MSKIGEIIRWPFQSRGHALVSTLAVGAIVSCYPLAEATEDIPIYPRGPVVTVDRDNPYAEGKARCPGEDPADIEEWMYWENVDQLNPVKYDVQLPLSEEVNVVLPVC